VAGIQGARAKAWCLLIHAESSLSDLAGIIVQALASGDYSVVDDAACTQFSCLALLAHLLNERVVARMQSAAKAGSHGWCSPRFISFIIFYNVHRAPRRFTW